MWKYTNSCILQGCIILIKSGSKDIYNVIKIFPFQIKSFTFELLFSSTTVFNIVNNKKCFVRFLIDHATWSKWLLKIQLCSHKNKWHFTIYSKYKTTILNCSNISLHITVLTVLNSEHERERENYKKRHLHIMTKRDKNIIWPLWACMFGNHLLPENLHTLPGCGQINKCWIFPCTRFPTVSVQCWISRHVDRLQLKHSLFI